MKKICNISILGDSIFRGVVLDSGSGRYRINDGIGIDCIAEKYSMTVTNLSRFGCTVGRGIENLRKYLDRGNAPDAVLLELGGNDSDFNWADIAADPTAEHLPNTPLPIFVGTYREMISLSRAHGIEPIVSNLAPVCPERYLGWICRDGLDRESILRWLGSPSAIYSYQENYSNAIESIARECSCAFIDIRGAFLAHRRLDSLYCDDGIHPNTDGQRLIRETLIEIIEKNKGVCLC